MSKFKSNKMWLIFTLLFLGFTSANALGVGDRIYVIFGSGSSAFVKGGNVLRVGGEISKIDWNDCDNCREWIKNSSFYYSRAKANKRVDEMDSNHISAGEVAGTVVVIGGLTALIHAISKK